MTRMQTPSNDDDRIRKLHEYRILDTPPEQVFDDTVSLAAMVCAVPIAMFTLIDRNREWYKAKKGIGLEEHPRNGGFGTYTIQQHDLITVADARQDARFADHPLVASDPWIRFYAGVPVRAATGEALGTLCVLDKIPRQLLPEQLEALRLLARQTASVLDLRRRANERDEARSEVGEEKPLPPLTEQTALHHSLRFARAILDALPLQFCVLDKNGRILGTNRPWQAHEQDGGYPGAKIGQNYWELLERGRIQDRGGEAFVEGMRAVISGEKSGFSLAYQDRNARTVPQWFAGKVMPFPEQELAGILVVHQDITEHKLLEHRFRQVVEFSPSALVMINETGIILMVNAQTEASFGYSRDELVGQPVELLLPERFRTPHVDFRQAYAAMPVSRPMGAGRDLYGLRKDGTEFPVEISLSFIEEHEETLVLGSIVDISRHKQLEHRFRQAVEAAPNAIVMVNESGIILMVNLQTERSFGYSRFELIGQSVEILVPERFREEHADYRQNFFAEPRSRPMGAGRDLYARRKDGSEFPVEIGLGLIDDENGLIVLSSIIDITERMVANDKLKQAVNEKEILLKEVYHRVKNNLQVVSSMINLQARNVKHDLARDLLQQSADRVKSMALLHEKLYQSKDLTRIDFKAYVHSLVDYLMFGHGDSSARIRVGLQIEDVFLDVDTAIPCGLIINELLSNALKHAFPDNRPGRIDISFRHDQNEYVLEVADNGIGFPPGLDFKQSSSLGLQLVTTLTNQLLGHITLDRNHGSIFTIRFDENSGH